MHTRPLISIIHPTARIGAFPSFPRGWKDAALQFAESACRPHEIEYVLVVHHSRWREFWTELHGGFPLFHEIRGVDATCCAFSSSDTTLYGHCRVVRNEGRDCVVDQINAGAAACTGQLILGMMDDLQAPRGWDAALLQLLDDSWVDGYCPEAVIDLTGEPTEWIVYSALTRARYENQGFILDPRFESMYADNWYSHLAHKDGVVINGRHLGFKHNHPSNGRAELDAVYSMQNRGEAYAEGRALFSKLTTGRQTLAIVTPGESFPMQWVANYFDLSWNLAAHYDVQPHFGFSSMVHGTRYDLNAGLLDAKPHPDLVLWMDDDNICSYAHVERLLRDLEERPDLDGIVGWCWCDNKKDQATKPADWTMSVGKLSAADDFGGHNGLRFNDQDFAGGPIISARDIQQRYGSEFGFWTGFPCVLLRWETLLKMGRDCFAPILHPKANRGFTGEDAAYCWRARQLGVNLAVDLRVKVPHLKLGAFEPDFVSQLAAAAPQSASLPVAAQAQPVELPGAVPVGV